MAPWSSTNTAYLAHCLLEWALRLYFCQLEENSGMLEKDQAHDHANPHLMKRDMRGRFSSWHRVHALHAWHPPEPQTAEAVQI